MMMPFKSQQIAAIDYLYYLDTGIVRPMLKYTEYVLVKESSLKRYSYFDKFPFVAYPLAEKPFVSIQGEGPFAGVKSYFIRFAGCDLRCSFCDTRESWNIKNAIYWEINPKTEHIVITGGEPLLYPHIVTRLLQHFPYAIFTIETNGNMLKRFAEVCNRSRKRVEFYLSISPKNYSPEFLNSLFETVGEIKGVEDFWFKFVLVDPRKELEQILSSSLVNYPDVYVTLAAPKATITQEYLKKFREVVSEISLPSPWRWYIQFHKILGVK